MPEPGLRGGLGGLGRNAPPPPPGPAPAAVAAALLAVVWAVGWGALWAAGATGGGVVAALLVMVVPVAALALLALSAQEMRRLSAEAAALRATLAAQRGAGSAPPRAEPARSPAPPPVPVAPSDTPAPRAEQQPTLALVPDPGDESPPLPRADLIRALNFPLNDRDREGFEALRRASRDHAARGLIQAAQDMLTLLSQDGIYTDDLRPDLARPEIWRRFAQGERGRALGSLGGIRDRATLLQVQTRMREDTIFRDTAHHFLRLFDRMLAVFEPEASDEELVALSDTRSARAFMLIGRVAGTFD